MAGGEISMEVRLATAAHAVLRDAGGATVTAVCKELGISRERYYAYRKRMAGRDRGIAAPVASTGPVPDRYLA